MITGLDHVVVLVGDLAAASAGYQTLLARAPAWSSRGEGSQTALFTLDNVTLELLAPAGDGATADRIRAVLAERGEGLASLCFAVDDIERMHRRLERLALKPDAVTAVESADLGSGAVLSWRRTRAETAASHGVRLFFLQLAEQRPKSVPLAAAPIDGLDHVVISTADPERGAALYGARLGLDMALDRTHQDWGRLMFFRCGDLFIELVQRPGTGTDRGHDRLWGLSWRVAEIDAARARLLAAGLEVTEVRPGRKPGTRVANVRSGTSGVPTLLLEPAAAKSVRN